MHSADYAVSRCLSVRPSHAGLLSKRLNVSSRAGMKKSPFSTNISLYLGNDARQSHRYYVRRIGNRIPNLSNGTVSMTLSDSEIFSDTRVDATSRGLSATAELLVKFSLGGSSIRGYISRGLVA